MSKRQYYQYCVSCKLSFYRFNGNYCDKCYSKAIDTKEELHKEIEELKSFFTIFSPLDPRSPGFTDVVLIPSDELPDDKPDLPVSIPAHKAILVARSPVFKAMLDTDYKMEESLTSIIKISDVSHYTLKAFINYLYTAEIQTTTLDEQLARDLIVLAEKYEVKHLKSHCENFLMSKVGRDNSVSMLCFAHQHNADRLLQCCLSIIADNMNEFTKTDEYSQLVDRDSKLVVKIYESYIIKKK